MDSAGCGQRANDISKHDDPGPFCAILVYKNRLKQGRLYASWRFNIVAMWYIIALPQK